MISEQPVEYKAGKNRYVVPIKLRTPGYYEYSATIETPPEPTISSRTTRS